MRALLDTNIVIHRENTQTTSLTIGKLFYWLDKLHYEKIIHPYTVVELRKYHNSQIQSLYDAKLDAYTTMRCVAMQTKAFQELLKDSPKTDNDYIDNQLLYEVYCGRADILITEDRRMHNKAERLGLSNQIFTINTFIGKASNENPELIDYKVLSVKKEFFGNIDLTNPFFDTFRDAYDSFDGWFASKCDEEAYICRSDNNDILGFLYLKTENETENYSDINPIFPPKKRLKVGTFKVEASGFRLGERFVKIIIDNAIERHLDEIYVTLFTNRFELKLLYDLLLRWGFFEYGTKTKNGKVEIVLVKRLGIYNPRKSVVANYPNLNHNSNKMILPIAPPFHTTLFPDSKLNTEKGLDLLSNIPHRYALQKVYISWAKENNIKTGDLLLFYRMGDTIPKKYSSVITTLGVVDQVISKFDNEKEFLSYCQNRSVFSIEDLKYFWNTHRYNLKVIKFVYVKSLSKKLTLNYMWNNNIVQFPNGPRPFTKITDAQFNMILRDSDTKIFM